MSKFYFILRSPKVKYIPDGVGRKPLNDRTVKLPVPPKPVLIRQYPTSKANKWIKKGLYQCKVLHEGKTCNKKFKANSSSVEKGNTKSCGCFHRISNVFRSTVHGHSISNNGQKNKSTEYVTWQDMFKRCYNKNDKHYKDYGGRGIKVCIEWLKFENFLKDMGEKPRGYSIDRINNSKGYYKENCRWATPKEQALNRRNNKYFLYLDSYMLLTDIYEMKRLKVSSNTFRKRVNSGWSIEDALYTPLY